MCNDIPCVRFRQGKKTIEAINLHKDYYDFQIVLSLLSRGYREKRTFYEHTNFRHKKVQ